MKVTEIPYIYRDGNNFKAVSQFVLAGEITEAQKEALRESLDSGEYFIAEQLGLQHLGFTEPTWTSFPNEDDDHPFHELWLDRITVTSAEETPEQTVEEFVAMFTAIGADGWDSVKYSVPGEPGD